MSAKDHKKLIFLIIIVIILLNALINSKHFDSRPTSIIYFFHSISIWYYILYFTILLSIFYHGLLNIIKNKQKSSEILIFMIILLAFLIYFPLLLFTNPIQVPTFQHGKVYHILQIGSLANIPGKSESVGNAIIWALYILITSINLTCVTNYLAPIFYYISTLLIIYCLTRLIINEQLICFICTLYSMGLLLDPLLTSRYSFGLTLHSLMFLLLFSSLVNNELIRLLKNMIIILVIIFSSLVITHPVFSAYDIFILSTYTLLTSVKIKYNKIKYQTISSNNMEKYVIICFAIIWVIWFLSKYHLEGFFLFVEKLNLLTNWIYKWLQRGFYIRSLELSQQYNLNPIFKLLVIGRMMVVTSITFVTLLLYAFIKFKNLDSTKLNCIFVLWFITVFILFLSNQSISAVMRAIQVYLPITTFLLALELNHIMPKFKKYRHVITGVFIEIFIVLSLITVLIWGPNINYIQIPSKKVATIIFFANFSESNPRLYTMKWSFSQYYSLFKYIYAKRVDIRAQMLFDLREDLNVIKIIRLLYYKRNGYFFIDGSIKTSEIKYIFHPSLSERLETIEYLLRKNNKIYMSSKYYSIFEI